MRGSFLHDGADYGLSPGLQSLTALHVANHLRREQEAIERRLAAAIKARLCAGGRILPGEEIHREPTPDGGYVVYTYPE